MLLQETVLVDRQFEILAMLTVRIPVPENTTRHYPIAGRAAAGKAYVKRPAWEQFFSGHIRHFSLL